MLFNLLADLRLLGMFTALGLLRWTFVLGLPGSTGFLRGKGGGGSAALRHYLNPSGGTRTKRGGKVASKRRWHRKWLKVDPRTFFFDAIAPAGSAMKARFSGDR